MGFRRWWRDRQRKRHMLDGPGMRREPENDNGKYSCPLCGKIVAVEQKKSMHCPHCGIELPQHDKEC